MTTRAGMVVAPSSSRSSVVVASSPSVLWSAACTRTTFSNTALRARGLASSHE